MRIMISGATGFIGRHMSAYFRDLGHDVVALDRRLFEAGNCSIECDAFVHLAGVAHSNAHKSEYQAVTRLTESLAIRSSREKVKHFIFVSSISAQSAAVSDRILTEADAPQPDTHYGREKLAAELAVAASGVPFTILRPVVVTGPGAKGNVGIVQQLAALPLPLPIRSIESRRSFISIDDLNTAVQTVLLHPKAFGQTFIVADPRPKTISEVVSDMRRRAGRSAQVFRFPPSVLRLLFTALRLGPMWNRIDGPLIAQSDKLQNLGWRPSAEG